MYCIVIWKGVNVVDFRVVLIVRHSQRSVTWLKSHVRSLSAWTLCRSWRPRSLLSTSGKKRPRMHLLLRKILANCLRYFNYTIILSLPNPAYFYFINLLALQQQPFYSSLIQDNPGEPVLSQRRDLLEQPLDFYEPDVLPAAQPIVSKHYRKTQWFGRLLFYRHGISIPCLTNSVKALNEAY